MIKWPEKRSKKTSILWIPLHSVRKWIVSLCLVLAIIAIMTAEMPATRTWTYWTIPLSGKVVVIDAGHGGPDGGAVSKQGVIEKDINLSIALYLRDYLQQAGAIVFMTREGDYDLAAPDTKGYAKRKAEDLKRRVSFVQEKKSDILISLHMNSIPSGKWSGAQSFYTKRHPESERLAKSIQSEIRRNLENTDRVSKLVERRLYLMDRVEIPSALVEVGFLSNREESRQLADEQYQRKVAASVYKGILRFMAKENIGK